MEKKMNIATLFGRLFKSVREYTKPSILSPVFVMGEVIMISQQVNSIAMAMAGATRIFALIDEKPETDEGRVSLVCTCCGEDGFVRESPYRTASWA